MHFSYPNLAIWTPIKGDLINECIGKYAYISGFSHALGLYKCFVVMYVLFSAELSNKFNLTLIFRSSGIVLSVNLDIFILVLVSSSGYITGKSKTKH